MLDAGDADDARVRVDRVVHGESRTLDFVNATTVLVGD